MCTFILISSGLVYLFSNEVRIHIQCFGEMVSVQYFHWPFLFSRFKDENYLNKRSLCMNQQIYTIYDVIGDH